MRWRLPLLGSLVWLSALAATAQIHEDPGDPHIDHSQHLEHGAPPQQVPGPDPHVDRPEHAEHQRADPPAAADPHAGHAVPQTPAAAGGAHADHPPRGAAGDAAVDPHAHHAMTLDADGMVMNHNPDRLPRDCPEIAGDVELRVQAGKDFALAPGLVYGYDAPSWQVPPCSRVNITLDNQDSVRHQWMVHGLPRYLYPMGMFTLEINGPGTRSASFIVPSADKTYLVHCDVPHHMEKGMKAQLVVGAGDGTLPSVPGLSEALFRDPYTTRWNGATVLSAALAGALGLALSAALLRR